MTAHVQTTSKSSEGRVVGASSEIQQSSFPSVKLVDQLPSGPSNQSSFKASLPVQSPILAIFRVKWQCQRVTVHFFFFEGLYFQENFI